MNVVARPRSLFTFEFDCYDESEQIVASFRHRAFRSGDEIRVGGARYRVQRTGAGLAVRDESGLLTASLSAGSGMTLRWDDEVRSVARSGLGFRMMLLDRGHQVAEVGLRDMFGRTMVFQSDEDVPLVVVAALFWLAVARRRQFITTRR